MHEQFNSTTFLVEIVIAMLLCIVMYAAVAFMYSKEETIPKKIEYLLVPANNALVILGLIVPILSGLAAYFYVNNPKMPIGSLLAAICSMFAILVFSIWQSFSLVGKA